jgi:hypothetical protein
VELIIKKRKGKGRERKGKRREKGRERKRKRREKEYKIGRRTSKNRRTGRKTKDCVT